MNAVQLQKGLSMVEFHERYGSETQCKQAVMESIWPRGFMCPACEGTGSRSFRRGGLRYWECLACSHQCNLISGTAFEATKLKLTRWFLAMHLLTQPKSGVSALDYHQSTRLIEKKPGEALQGSSRTQHRHLPSTARLMAVSGAAMRIKDVRPQSFVFQLLCDRCGAEAQHNVDDGFNNFLQIEFDASWGSDLGDGNHVDLDICHACLKETLGPWLRVSPAAWAAAGQVSADKDLTAGVQKVPDQERGGLRSDES